MGGGFGILLLSDEEMLLLMKASNVESILSPIIVQGGVQCLQNLCL